MKDPYDSSNSAHVEKAQNEQAIAAQQLISDLQFILETKAGRNVMAWIFDLSKPHAISFTGNSNTFFNEGKRSVGVPIYAAVMENYPELYLKLMEETKGRSYE